MAGYTVGRRIKDLRQSLSDRAGVRITQDEVARRVGVSKSAVAKWETDVWKPSGDALLRLADVLNTTAEYILHGRNGSDEPPSSEGLSYGNLEADAEQADRMFADFDRVIRQMGGADMSADERHNRQLDALEGLRRFFSARGPIPTWWYETKAKVDRGEL